jgi:hypothetical protein
MARLSSFSQNLLYIRCKNPDCHKIFTSSFDRDFCSGGCKRAVEKKAVKVVV